MQLSKCHRVAVSRDACIQLNVTSERDSNYAMYDLIEEAETGACPSLCQATPTQSFNFSFYLSILSRSNFDHHLRCGGWLNFEFS